MCGKYAVYGMHIQCVRDLEVVWNSTRIHGIFGMCMDFRECVECIKSVECI